jgi:hypothetical protein
LAALALFVENCLQAWIHMEDGNDMKTRLQFEQNVDWKMQGGCDPGPSRQACFIPNDVCRLSANRSWRMKDVIRLHCK